MLPVFILAVVIYERLELEAFSRFRVTSEEISNEVNRKIESIVKQEEGRGFSEYSFNHSQSHSSSKRQDYGGLELEPSSLSANVQKNGFIGYFQYGPNNVFTTPLLPRNSQGKLSKARINFSTEELNVRVEREKKLSELLSKIDFEKNKSVFT